MTGRHPLENRVPPPLVGVAAAGAQRLLPSRPSTTRRRIMAAGVALGSVGLAVAAERHFSRHGTTVNPLSPDKASSLVTGGPFKVTRNPMYVGVLGVLLAHAIARGRPASVLPAAAWAAYIDRFQIRPEEHALERLFGPEYAAYRQRVRRWL